MYEFEYQLLLEECGGLTTKVSKKNFFNRINAATCNLYSTKLLVHMYNLGWDKSETGVTDILTYINNHILYVNCNSVSIEEIEYLLSIIPKTPNITSGRTYGNAAYSAAYCGPTIPPHLKLLIQKYLKGTDE